VGNYVSIPASNYKQFILNQASLNNISYNKTPTDCLADRFTALSDDTVVLDDIENLIIALERAGIIESKDVLPLHVGYLRERKAGRI